MNTKAWISAFRLRTLPLALASIGMGSFLAASHQKFRYDVLIWASLTTVFLQVLSNLANDYGDTINGADSELRQGPTRAVQSGAISISSMKIAIGVFGILSFASGLMLLHISVGLGSTIFYLFLGFGLASIAAAYFYTAGKNPYGYAGLGDISVLLFFGFLAVLGTYFLHTVEFTWLNILPALSMGLFATAVLNVNNIRDIESDKEAGKMSIPVRIGRNAAVKYHLFLLITGYGTSLVYIFLLPFSYSRIIVLLAIFPLVINAKAVTQKTDAKQLDPYLRQMAISSLLFMLLFGLAIL
ncbi:1,4-dihydroxy-2-naphthoate polyprenyltransferase [hydrothermal vent metagenome]|uniref:1,4-dihydroxy-2-naphthoate polyprenyltransferase n=1 Tax=hydrothermal vent metagenome TaxID=652676 RepID=A0A3B0UI64_9ZZZZ